MMASSSTSNSDVISRSSSRRSRHPSANTPWIAAPPSPSKQNRVLISRCLVTICVKLAFCVKRITCNCLTLQPICLATRSSCQLQPGSANTAFASARATPDPATSAEPTGSALSPATQQLAATHPCASGASDMANAFHASTVTNPCFGRTTLPLTSKLKLPRSTRHRNRKGSRRLRNRSGRDARTG
ncbi:hypothetical protein LMG24238_07115 [Paraburkholderia sediminicola]|uniref:Uncharacterized protein n=1 Tax=Paraburkholderia sediminicola TaxID=458836 RepID=A0A6J5CRE1_9BURK|nr:hypothetical protein LMG24238_07115 [Paraburkholderia sediminicola]